MAKQDTDGHATESEQLISVKVEDPYPSLTTSLTKKLGEFTPISPDCCIFRASKRDRKKNEKAFDPFVVSIGPFHHGKEKLRSMERLKVGYLNAFLSRSDHINLEALIKVIKESEKRIRNCYAETIQLRSDAFVEMILLDSCFVIEVIWRDYYDDNERRESDHLSHPRIIMDVARDTMLLENQLPFFILDEFFNLAFPDSIDTDECFINLCIKFVSVFSFNRDVDLFKRRISEQQPTEVKHLLDLLRKCQVPDPTIQSPRRPGDSSVRNPTMRNATELEKAGLVIKPSLNQSSATDIRYTDGVLEIPKVTVRLLSTDVLRNLIALEFCIYLKDSYISDYIRFMDNLIETGKDVDLLIQNGVFELAVDTEAVANIFNSLKPFFNLTNYYYHGIQEDIEAYSKVNWHTWGASLRRDYCSSPWIIASTVAAIILLLLTFNTDYMFNNFGLILTSLLLCKITLLCFWHVLVLDFIV